MLIITPKIKQYFFDRSLRLTSIRRSPTPSPRPIPPTNPHTSPPPAEDVAPAPNGRPRSRFASKRANKKAKTDVVDYTVLQEAGDTLSW